MRNYHYATEYRQRNKNRYSPGTLIWSSKQLVTAKPVAFFSIPKLPKFKNLKHRLLASQKTSGIGGYGGRWRLLPFAQNDTNKHRS